MHSAFAPALNLSFPRASPRPPPTARPTTASLTGSDRRFLRSEAGRRDAANTLAYIRLPHTPSPSPSPSSSSSASSSSSLDGSNGPDGLPEVLPPPLPDGVVAEIGARLAREEIVRVKTSAKKKRTAKAVGEALADVVGGELVQVLGHTVLLYRAGVEGEMAEGRAKVVLPSGG